MRSLNSCFKRVGSVSCLGLTAMLLVACGGSGHSQKTTPLTPINPLDPNLPLTPITPGNPPLVPVVPCVVTPPANTRFPAKNVNSVDQVFYNYTQPDTVREIYGYKNEDPLHVKKVNVINNYSQTIYPVFSSPTAFTGSDGKIKSVSRIFVGKPSCLNSSAFYAGLPPNSSTTVYIPKQMWDAGHVKVFTELPDMLQKEVGSNVGAPLYTVDTNKDSPNYGHFIYTAGTVDGKPAGDFPLDLPYQLTEYTFENDCKDSNGNDLPKDSPICAAEKKDTLTVDFDISSVDHLYLPVAMVEGTGSRGYVGTDKSVESLQASILEFVKGGVGVSYSDQVGWPYYYGSASNGVGYSNNLIKIPAGLNVLDSILFPKISFYNHSANIVGVFDKTTNQFVDDQVISQKVLDNFVSRWSAFWQADANFCSSRGLDPTYCGEFIKTMKFMYNNIVTACQFSLGTDAALCTQPNNNPANNARSVLTDIDKIKAFVGYTPLAITFADDGPLAAKDPDNICTVENGPAPLRNGEFYSNCLRDAFKSVVRGVPYPFWKYRDKFYPDLSSPYTLLPIAWFIHNRLGLSQYAFSVDDDIGNQELVGNSFTLAVGGIKGLKVTNHFDPKLLQILAFPGGTKNPQWQGTVSSSPTCVPPRVGACDININDGAYKSVDVSLTGIPAVTNKDYFLKFTITTGAPQTCNRGTIPYTYKPIVLQNCSTSPGLKNCNSDQLFVSFSDTSNCAQTVNITVPVT